MSKYKILLIVLIAISQLGLVSYAQYYFQSGAMTGKLISNNQGASVMIDTVSQPYLKNGSFGFWVGEDLSNGAFVQVGYEIPNKSGSYLYYTENCSSSACESTAYANSGAPEWFWEYFPKGYDGGNFYGGIGADYSAGSFGLFNRYAFIYNGSSWVFYFNNQTIGNVSLGSSSSGINSPVAFAEDAGTENNSTIMENVTFKNFQYYVNGSFINVPQGYSYIGYGADSENSLKNSYGVNEIDNRLGSFEVGSMLPEYQNSTLWRSGYYLNIVSEYGSPNDSGEYLPDWTVNLSVPDQIYLSPEVRVVFAGWNGSGNGAYTGVSNGTIIRLDNNITEYARWKTEYYVNDTYQGITSGTGWYPANTVANLTLENTTIYTGNGTREIFDGWSSNQTISNSSSPILMLRIDSPIDLIPEFYKEYMLRLIPENFYGDKINVSSININGVTSNTAEFLSSGIYKIEYINYKNTTIYINKTFTLNGASEVSFIAPVYNINISARGVFDGIVNPLAYIVFKNGTKMDTRLGGNGALKIDNVPYGYANVSLTYFGQKFNFELYDGKGISAKFITPYIIAIVIMIIVVVTGILMSIKRRRRTK